MSGDLEPTTLEEAEGEGALAGAGAADDSDHLALGDLRQVFLLQDAQLQRILDDRRLREVLEEHYLLQVLIHVVQVHRLLYLYQYYQHQLVLLQPQVVLLFVLDQV